jgi:hypothetical protein
LNSRTDYGWTPLMITKAIFMANSKKEFPAAARIIEKALAAKGINKQAAR